MLQEKVQDSLYNAKPRHMLQMACVVKAAVCGSHGAVLEHFVLVSLPESYAALAVHAMGCVWEMRTWHWRSSLLSISHGIKAPQVPTQDAY